jgi:hypothetical protein
VDECDQDDEKCEKCHNECENRDEKCLIEKCQAEKKEDIEIGIHRKCK